MKKTIIIITLCISCSCLLYSCTKENDSYDNFNANISGSCWGAGNVSTTTDSSGFTYIEGDNSDGSFFYISLPQFINTGTYPVSANDVYSIEYLDPQGVSYSLQGSITIVYASYRNIQGSFEGAATNGQGQINVSGSFNANF